MQLIALSPGLIFSTHTDHARCRFLFYTLKLVQNISMASNHPFKLHSSINRLQFDIPDDSEDHLIASLRTHPDVRPHLPMFPFTMTVEQAASLRLYRASNPTYCDYHVHIVKEGIRKFVGMIGSRNLDEDNGSVEMGILLFQNSMGKATGRRHCMSSYATSLRSAGCIA